MPLSLHSEYLLGYLAGARSMDPRAAASLTQAMCEDATQARALLRALALGMSDGRRNRALREGHEVRLHVLALLTRETSPGPMGRCESGRGAGWGGGAQRTCACSFAALALK